MGDMRIRYVAKDSNDHEGISEVGDTWWRWTVAQVVASIEERSNTFYTYEGGVRAEVGVLQGKSRKYLQTHADGRWTNNLLALPGFPVR